VDKLRSKFSQKKKKMEYKPGGFMTKGFREKESRLGPGGMWTSIKLGVERLFYQTIGGGGEARSTRQFPRPRGGKGRGVASGGDS